MSLSCYLKSAGFTLYEVARRIPRVLWEIIRGVAFMMISVIPLLIAVIIIIVACNYFPEGLQLPNTLAYMLMTLVVISLILSLIMVFVTANARDFRFWSLHFGKPCNEETYKEYIAFKKSLGVSYIGTAFYYNISRMEIVPVEKRD